MCDQRLSHFLTNIWDGTVGKAASKVSSPKSVGAAPHAQTMTAPSIYAPLGAGFGDAASRMKTDRLTVDYVLSLLLSSHIRSPTIPGLFRKPLFKLPQDITRAELAALLSELYAMDMTPVYEFSGSRKKHIHDRPTSTELLSQYLIGGKKHLQDLPQELEQFPGLIDRMIQRHNISLLEKIRLQDEEAALLREENQNLAHQVFMLEHQARFKNEKAADATPVRTARGSLAEDLFFLPPEATVPPKRRRRLLQRRKGR